MTAPLKLYWFLPSHGDGREVAKPAPGKATVRPPRREPDIGYLAQVATAAEAMGFTGALVPFGLFCEDPWLVTAALAQLTERLKFMIAVRPGFVSPVLLAQMGATLQRITGNRVFFNVVSGGDSDEQHRYGDWLNHDERYERTAEFLQIVRSLWAGDQVSMESRYHHLDRAVVTRPPAIAPQLFVGGSSAAARTVASAHADVYLAWGETPPLLAGLVSEARTEATASDRQLTFGSRFHVITRDDAADAWAVADQLLAGMDQSRIDQAQARFSRSDSEGQRRAARLHVGRVDRLEVYPNIWAGYGLVRPGVGAALVGSHEEVADRIFELHNIGLDHLILSGQPHLEESYAFGEGVMPILRARGVLDDEPLQTALQST